MNGKKKKIINNCVYTQEAIYVNISFSAIFHLSPHNIFFSLDFFKKKKKFEKERESKSLSPSPENPLLKNSRRPLELLSTVITYFVFNLCSSLIFYSSSSQGKTRSKVLSVVLLHLCSFDCRSLSFAFVCEY